LTNATASPRASAHLPAALKPEQLFELVDDHEHVLAGRQPRQLDRVGEAARAPPQRGIDHGGAADPARLRRLVEHVRCGDGGRQLTEGIVTRPEDRDAPAGPGADHLPAVK
jgi:hypothetical protein